jgi:hypothetical protein
MRWTRFVRGVTSHCWSSPFPLDQESSCVSLSAVGAAMTMRAWSWAFAE